MAVASTAQAYATFGGLLTGFAFSGLCVYISREVKHAGTRGAVTYTGHVRRPIVVKDVAVAVFLAMVSLAISSFLYANLAGVADANPGAAITALLTYGIVFALSVLSLFYAVTLMMLEHPLTEHAAKTGYWVVTIAGTVIVLRFLASTTSAVAVYRCHHVVHCEPPGVLSPWGIVFTLIIAMSLAMLTATVLQEHEPGGRIGALTNHPALPPVVVFLATVFVAALESVYLSTRDHSYVPSDWFIYLSYGTSIFLVGLFAFVCGRVISPRAEILMPMATRLAGLFTFLTVVSVAVLFCLTPLGYPILSVLLPAAAVVILIAHSRGWLHRVPMFFSMGRHAQQGQGAQ